MLKIFLLAVFALASVCAEGEFIVLDSPDSIQLDNRQPLNQSMLKDIITAILGFTVQPNHQWDGLAVTNPFGLPEATVIVVVEDVDSLESSRGIKFALNVDENEERTWQVVRQRLEDRDKNNTLIRIRVGDGFDALGQSSLGELKPNYIERTVHLNPKNETDHRFIREVQLLRAIAQNVPLTVNANSKPDVYWLIVSGLGPVIDYYGKDSLAAKEAFKLLDDALEEIRQAFIEVYKNNVFIAALTSDSNKVRDTRSVNSLRERRAATEATKTDGKSDTNEKATDTPSAGVKSKMMDEEEVKIIDEDEGSNNETDANVEIITEVTNVLVNTESLGRELNHLTHKIHSLTGGENTDKPVK
ncbi:hypothetical protein PV326_005556, partial [Microctonus aethiopoides]